MQVDIPLMIALSIGMVAIGIYRKQLSRWTGALFLGGYGTYMFILLA